MTGVSVGIDTSTDWLSVALYSPAADEVIASHESRAGRQHASLLMPAVQQLLADAGLEPADISAVGAGTGPGSYTGLRVGLASARGLAGGLDVPLGGTVNLEAAAFRQLRPGQEAWLTIDARRGNVYAARYSRGENTVICTAEPRKLPLSELQEAQRPGLPVLEAGAPDAGWIARRATAGGDASALYL